MTKNNHLTNILRNEYLKNQNKVEKLFVFISNNLFSFIQTVFYSLTVITSRHTLHLRRYYDQLYKYSPKIIIIEKMQN